MKRLLIGFAVRIAIAAAISLFVWWLFTTPYDRLPLPRGAISVIVRVLDFPVAVAGELLYPIRGMELVFVDRSPRVLHLHRRVFVGVPRSVHRESARSGQTETAPHPRHSTDACLHRRVAGASVVWTDSCATESDDAY
jgi:hypothetical protein